MSNERIETDGSGSLQVMFVDKSSLTIGPNSNLVIDQFVYNAGGGTGQFAASLTKGAVRFVGGQISHTAGATINTPSATIGIRGGAALITHNNSGCQPDKANGVNQARRSTAGNHVGECTKVYCLGGTCQVTSLGDAKSYRLAISQAIEISSLVGSAAQPFSVNSVNLHDNTATTGGTNGGTNGNSGQVNFVSQGAIDQAISEQEPEPIAAPSSN